MDMPTDSPEAQEKCPACGEPNCLDHALRTAPAKAEAQPQGVKLLPCPLVHPIKNGVKFTGFSKGPTNKSDRYHIWCYDCGLAFEGQPSETAESVARRWNTRVDLPRATADTEYYELAYAIMEEMGLGFKVRNCSCGQLPCARLRPIAEALAKCAATPRATGETEVEAALAELREMFPGKAILIRREDSFYPPDCRDSAETNSMVTIKIGYLESEPKFRSFRSFADCMAQVRAATRTEEEGEKS
jgi:hypothetical protein